MFRTLGQYYIWAHDRYRDVFHQLTEDEFNKEDELVGKSIRQLLEHVLQITKYGISGDEEMMDYAERIVDLDKSSLIDEWKVLDLELSNRLLSVNSSLIDLEFLTGETTRIPENVYFLIFTDHMTFHRGQFLSALKHLGRKGISSDLYYFIYEQEMTKI